MTSLRLDAPAKVNLTLRITGRRQDGYHLIDSLVIFADLKDTMIVTSAKQDSLTITGPYSDALNTISPKDNSIIIALEAFRQYTGWNAYFDITLDKQIPVAAGLGGGSSNGAAILKFLNYHCPTPLDESSLRQLGLSLGADLPCCLGGQSYHLWRMRGVGEILDRVDLPSSVKFGLILINPDILVPTESIFAALKSQEFSDHDLRQGQDLTKTLTDADFKNWLDDGNGLETVAIALHSQVQSAISMAQEFDKCDGFITAGMSGSGATIFALFETEDHARIAHQDIPNSSYWSWVGGIYQT